MSQSTESATSRTPAASARQTASIPLSEETFRRWLAVLIAAVTLLVAIAAFLQTRAADHASSFGRASQRDALAATGEQTRGQQQYEFDQFSVMNLRDELYSQAVSAGASSEPRTPLGQAYLDAMNDPALRALSPLLNGDYVQADETGYRTVTDYGRYQVETYVLTTTLLSERREAYAHTSADWNNKADYFIALIAILAVALFLFGLAGTLSNVPVRLIFIIVGLFITGIAALGILIIQFLPVHQTPEAALEQYARGKSAEHQAANYHNADAEQWRQHNQAFYAKALEAYNAALELDPQYANAYAARGYTLMNLTSHDADRATADLKRALDYGKRDYSTYWNYGFGLYLQAKYDAVRAPSEQALRLNPEVCGPAFNIAVAELALGKFDDAAAEYEKSIQLCEQIVQRARQNGVQAPSSLWNEMQGAVDDLDNLLCALSPPAHCYEGRAQPKISLSNTAELVTQATRWRTRLKEALAALEFDGTTRLPAIASQWSPLSFSCGAPDKKSGYIRTANQITTFPNRYMSAPPILAVWDYRGMAPGLKIHWKIFQDGAEETRLRFEEEWNLAQDGNAQRKLDSWYVLGNGLYEVEAYGGGKLLASGQFRIAPQLASQPALSLPLDTVAFTDTLDNNCADWPLADGAIRDGELQLVTHEQDTSFRSMCNYCYSVDDFYMEADTRYISGAADYGYGLVYRKTAGVNDFYTFNISGDGSFTVTRYAENFCDAAKTEHWCDVIPWTRSKFINPRGANKLGVSCRGAACDFYINNRLVQSANDEAQLNGYYGVNVGTADLTVAFDNVRVWDLE